MAADAISLWPERVGYDSRSGYKSEEYKRGSDLEERVGLLVDAWKAAAAGHGFRSEFATKLSCTKLDEGGHLLGFMDNKQEYSLKSRVESLSVSVDLDEDPGDTCIVCNFSGENLETGETFTYRLSIYRYPEIKAHASYTSTLPGEEGPA